MAAVIKSKISNDKIGDKDRLNDNDGDSNNNNQYLVETITVV